jgi:hypothetical protein
MPSIRALTLRYFGANGILKAAVLRHLALAFLLRRLALASSSSVSCSSMSGSGISGSGISSPVGIADWLSVALSSIIEYRIVVAQLGRKRPI